MKKSLRQLKELPWSHLMLIAIIVIGAITIAGCSSGKRYHPPYQSDNEKMTYLLSGWTFRYSGPTTDNRRINGILINYGAVESENKTPDIVVSQKEKEVIIYYHGITRKIPIHTRSFYALVDRVVVEMAQFRLQELASEMDKETEISDDGSVYFKREILSEMPEQAPDKTNP